MRTPISPDWRALGFYDPDAPDAAERHEVLAYYEANDIHPKDCQDIEPGELFRVMNRRAVRRGPRLDRDQARQKVGMDEALFDELSIVAGYPQNGDMYTPGDIETFELFKVAADFFSTDEVLHFTTVMTSSMARIADAATALFRIDVASELEATGGTELDFAKKNFEAAELVNLMGGPLWSLFVLQLELAAQRGDESRLAAAPDTDASVLKMGVGFVDLVGFTPLAVELSDGELASFIREFERNATAIVSNRGGRLVKLLGDEVMFVAVSADAAVHIAAELMAAFAEQGAQPHGGVAHGDLVSRGGDYYGPVVNLASRMATLAVPGELLVDVTTAESAGSHRFESAGRRQIKGFPEPIQLHSLLPQSSD
jgi:adenylate cyclase